MHDPVEQGLTQLTALRGPPALDAIEGEVFAALDEQARQHGAGRAAGMCSVAVALAIGLAGGTMLAQPALAAGPLGIDAALAPSTLLLGR